jgi:hypothetical protein
MLRLYALRFFRRSVTLPDAVKWDLFKRHRCIMRDEFYSCICSEAGGGRMEPLVATAFLL